jgi:hypothetical protein
VTTLAVASSLMSTHSAGVTIELWWMWLASDRSGMARGLRSSCSGGRADVDALAVLVVPGEFESLASEVGDLVGPERLAHVPLPHSHVGVVAAPIGTAAPWTLSSRDVWPLAHRNAESVLLMPGRCTPGLEMCPHGLVVAAIPASKSIDEWDVLPSRGHPNRRSGSRTVNSVMLHRFRREVDGCSCRMTSSRRLR